eukprot:TRINITY_DN23013_c0_g1_i1.p1 TRINITY_DN23013_c0_g1~~TRINITY_DN23013_c0_g1_i1.p1  ORF type:complete len:638 (+),score=172.99 TRINITY_DN23013_c0_g1_i1:169-1914(+)
MEMVRSYMTWGSVATVCAAVYLYIMMTSMHKFLYPLDYLLPAQQANSLPPQWAPGTELWQGVLLSNKPYECPRGKALDWVRKGKRKGTVVLHEASEPLLSGSSVEAVVNTTVGQLREAGLRLEGPPDEALHDIYMTFCVASTESPGGASKTPDTLAASVKIATTADVPKHRTLRWLLQDLGLGAVSGVTPYLEDELRGDRTQPPFYPTGQPVRQLKTEIVARLVSDTSLRIPDPRKAFIQNLHPFLQLSQQGGGYLPPFYSHAVNPKGEGSVVVVEDLISDADEVSWKIRIDSAELSRWLFVKHLENTKALVKKMGMESDMMDEMIEGFAGTSIPLLGLMMVAIVIHTLFDFFAFKSDVNFWQQNTSLRGLSVRSLGLDLVFQFITLIYLHNESATPLILAPCVVGLMIQVWKIRKATGFALSRAYPFYTTIRLDKEMACGKTDPIVEATLETDRFVMSYISFLVMPAVVGWAFYSLVFEKHDAWWSWFVNALASFVYSAGFLLMTPQIIINYKLKSVAAMPWDVMTYRFVNTFFDDLFAMVIALPSLHKMSVFRDDVVFIICIIQRFMYSVDRTRKEHAD